MRSPKLAKLAALLVPWALTSVLMVRDHLVDPFDATREGSAGYGHNRPGALVQGLVMTLVELVVMLALVRPWSYERSWGRASASAVLFVPWAFVSMVLTMHSGGIFLIHFLWVASLIAGLVVAAAWSGIAAIRHSGPGPWAR